jgi:MFS family permease
MPTPDLRRLLGSVGVRGVGYGMAGVMVGPYLALQGASPLAVGAVLTAALASNIVYTLLVTFAGERVGRRRTLVALGVIGTAEGLVFPLVSGSLPAMLLVAVVGILGAQGKDRGPFATVEQAILPETTTAARRTAMFSTYNLCWSATAALGALASGVVTLLHRTVGVEHATAYQMAFGVYAALLMTGTMLHARLSDAVEVTRTEEPSARPVLWPSRTQTTILRLSALFGLDALGGGLVVSTFVSYWFFVQWGLDQQALGLVFFAATLRNAVSYLAAPWLAHRVGLVHTMVIPVVAAQLFLVGVPLAPTAAGAVVLFLLRELVVQVDVPARQSYTVAVVDPAERTAAAGMTTLSRQLTQAAGPTVAGQSLAAVSAALPFFAAAAVKLIYAGILLASFRNHRPPEEVESAGRSRGDQPRTREPPSGP